MPPQALDQVTVLDLTQYIAGPYCTKLLADYGAHVIKVERPGRGDPARHMGPFFHDEPHPDKSGLFLHLNANKRSVTLDLGGTAGRRAFLRLVEEADILVESFAPRVMPSLDLDYEVLKKVYPALVMTSISNFGQTGPYRDFNSSEIVTYALGGPMYATGIASREPVKPGGSVLQYHAGATAASATMIAFWAAEQSGLGDHVDISLMRVQASNQDRRSTMLIAYQYTGLVSTRSETGGQRLGAGVRPCADGYVALGGDGPRFERAVRMIGRPDLLEDPRFKDSMARAQPGRTEEFDEYLLPWLLERTKLQVFQEAQSHHVPAGPINTTADLLTDPSIRGRRFWTTVKHPATGAVIHTGRPFIMAETPWRISTPAPRLGEHNQEVLMGRLGMSSQEVSSLTASPARRRKAAPPPRDTGDRQSPPSPRRLPLANVRVLALTVVWAGPHATQLLADWGAEVIRVESIQTMQPNTRARTVRVPKNMPPAGWGTAYPDMEPGERHWNRFALFQSHARNKLSMTVDLRSEEGRDIFHRLLMVSDVFVENNVPETVEKLHMTYEELVKIKPDLVMLRMPAYGLDGPYKNYRSFGSHLEGTAGHSSIRGYADMDPSVLDDSLMGDAAGGVNGALAIMLALRHRRRTGKGQLIELSQAENFLPYLGEAVMDYTMNSRVQGSIGNRHPNYAPQGAYRCRGEGRWVAISVGSELQWEGLRRALEEPAWCHDPRFSTGLGRWKHHDELSRHLDRWTSQRTSDEVMLLLQRHGVPAGALLDDGDLYRDPHMQAQHYFQELVHEDAGTHSYPGLLWTADNTPNEIRLPPCRLGEHNPYVYGDVLGVSEQEYRRLERAGHIGMDYAPHLP